MRVIYEEQVDKNVPWDFFDGASHNNGQACGGGAVLFLSDSHIFKIQTGLGSGSNNYAKCMALKPAILFVRENGVTSLQIYGDSLNVVNWARKLKKCHNIFLATLIEEIVKILNSFDSFSIHHVYRERNVDANALSKFGIELDFGSWTIQESKDETRTNSTHSPFI